MPKVILKIIVLSLMWTWIKSYKSHSLIYFPINTPITLGLKSEFDCKFINKCLIYLEDLNFRL